MHEELYRSGRSGWLRPAVLGANDGIVSTASLVIGVAAAAARKVLIGVVVVDARIRVEAASLPLPLAARRR